MLKRSGWAVLAAAASLFAGAALADEEIRYGAPPAWVKVAPIEPPAADPDAGGAIRIVHFDTQVRYGADGDDIYLDRAVQVLNRQGLEAVGTVGQGWHPGTQSLTVNAVEIIRDGQVIDALKIGEPFVALRQETNLAQAVLNGQLTATKQLEDVRVGDIVRVATTTRYLDPMVRGHSQYATGLAPGVPAIGYMRQRHLWAADKAMKWRAGDGFPKPTVTRTADGVELVAEGRDVKAPILPVGAPGRFRNLVVLTLSDFSSWKEVSALFADDYAAAATLAPDSPLKTEIEKIAQAHAAPVDRASAALALVQDRVRYLALAMGEGGFKPADADQTWSRKFGDCKGKSALLIALLNALGIEAEVVAVVASDDDDGYDDILPRLAFDHVIVRTTIDGKTYWLDPTRQGDGAIERLATPGYRWVLPIRANGATLEGLRQSTPALPETETVVDADYSGGLDLDAPLKVRVTYRGDVAAYQYAVLTAISRTEAESRLKERWTTDNWLIDNAAFGRAEDGTVWVEATGKQRGMWPRKGDRREFEAPYSSVSTDFEKRDPETLEPKAPYAIPFPSYDRFVSRTRLPAGGEGFDIVGRDVDIKAAGQWIVRRTRRENDVVIVEEDDRTTASEISFAEATAGPDRLVAAGATKDVIIRAPVNFRLSAKEVEKVAEERPERATWMMRAQTSFAAQDYDRALEDLDRVLAENPDDVRALTRRAEVSLARHDSEAALKDLEAALAREPQDASLLNYRANVYLSLDKLDLALADADASVAAAPSEWGGLVVRSQVRDRLGDREGKLADFARAVELAPENFYLRQTYTYMLHDRPGNEAALSAALEKLHADRITAAPKDAQRYLARAEMRVINENMDGALEDFSKAIALEPTAPAYLARAEAHRQSGDKANVLSDMDAAVKLDTSHRALLARARYNQMEGTPAQWLGDARAAMAKAPENVAALEEVARAALVAGDKARAREAADEMARLKPNDLEVLRLRALVKEQAGDRAGAIADMRLAVEGQGAAAAARSGRLRLARLLDEDGQHAEAIAVLGDVQKAFPQDAEILGRLCRAKAARNLEVASAVGDCDAALAITPDDPDYLDSLGLANLRLGRFDHAIAAYDEALRIRPGQTTTLYGRALAREGAGDVAGAIEDARLTSRFDRGGMKEMASYGLAARDPAVVQALTAAPADELEKTLPKDAVIKRPDWAGPLPTPEYPRRALIAKREGRGWLRCVVMAGGQLVNCRVENERPFDYEFGETMLKATRDMRMSPMTVNGEPVDGADVRFAMPFLLY